MHGYIESVQQLVNNHPATVKPSNSEQYFTYSSDNIRISEFVKSPQNTLHAFRHSHSDYEFILPRTPIPFLFNDNAVYFGEVGSVFPVQSGRQHGIKYDISDVAHDDIVIDKEYFEKLLTEKNIGGLQLNASFPVTDELRLYVSAFKKEYIKGKMADTHKLRHLTALIAYELIDSGENCSEDSRHENSGYQKGMRSAAEFINQNYEKELSLDELASLCGLSPNYFSSRFKKMFGETPFTYLTKLRVSKAKNFLISTGLSISEISERCGYSKVCSFSAAFRASTGLTPSQYRKLEK